MIFDLSRLLTKADQDHFYDVSLADSWFSMDSLAFNKTPNKSSDALSNHIPTGMTFSVLKRSEIKNNNMLLSTRTKLQIPCTSNLIAMVQA